MHENCTPFKNYCDTNEKKAKDTVKKRLMKQKGKKQGHNIAILNVLL